MSEAREKLRAATLGAPATTEKRLVKWNGEDFEIRPPSLKDQRLIDDASMIGVGKKAKRDGIKALMHALIKCVFVPGTSEHVFDPADVNAMEERNAKDFVGVFAKAIGELSEDSNPEAVEKNSESVQTDEP